MFNGQWLMFNVLQSSPLHRSCHRALLPLLILRVPSLLLEYKPEINLLLKLSLSNTGVEIPVLEQQRVFDKFYRIPQHDPWQFGGTAIGLALVKSSIALLEGKIELESKEEKTVFTIYLPCETR